jgi:hypothetical protein
LQARGAATRTTSSISLTAGNVRRPMETAIPAWVCGREAVGVLRPLAASRAECPAHPFGGCCCGVGEIRRAPRSCMEIFLRTAQPVDRSYTITLPNGQPTTVDCRFDGNGGFTSVPCTRLAATGKCKPSRSVNDSTTCSDAGLEPLILRSQAHYLQVGFLPGDALPRRRLASGLADHATRPWGLGPKPLRQ